MPTSLQLLSLWVPSPLLVCGPHIPFGARAGGLTSRGWGRLGEIVGTHLLWGFWPSFDVHATLMARVRHQVCVCVRVCACVRVRVCL